MVKDHSDNEKETRCRHIGFFYMHHPTDRIAHTAAFVTPVMEHWLEWEIAQWVHPMKDRSDNPSHHKRTLLPQSYISLPINVQMPMSIPAGGDWLKHWQTREGRGADGLGRGSLAEQPVLRDRQTAAVSTLKGAISGFKKKKIDF